MTKSAFARLFVVLFFAGSITLAVKHTPKPHRITNSFKLPHRDEVENSEALAEHNWLMLHDPKTGVIPAGIRAREVAFANRSEQAQGTSFKSGLFAQGAQLDWQPVGPPNVGGRSRQIAIDSTDHNTLLVAAAQGGVWRSTNRGSTWNITTAPDQLHDATCIVQDPHPGKQSIWYYGTGELLSTTFRRVSEVSEPRWRTTDYGNGIYRSINNGITWTPITSTISASSTTLDNPFDGIWSLVISPAAGSDAIYAACYGGIMRSTDFGNTWNRVLGDSVNSSFCSDVVCSSTGVLYAALSQYTLTGIDAPSAGIWRSIDGLTWTKISPANWPSLTRRMKLALAPSDENVLYVLMETPGLGRSDHSLWMHEFQAGGISPTMGPWEDRSAHIPFDATGNDPNYSFNSLGGYALALAVKPTDKNIVFIGGTNLYRSTDGFASDASIKGIGGYVQSDLHPDMHTIAFDPDDPNAMYVGNDGGLFFADNNRDSLMWQTLNNNYVSTIFFSVSLDHTATNDDTYLGGLQDNSSWIGGKNSLNWELIGAGDGCYSALADGSRLAYTSWQFGNVLRYKIDSTGNVSTYDYISPDVANSNFNFVTPWGLDPNDNSNLYMAATDAIELTQNAYGTAIWSRLSNTTLPDTSQIGCIGFAKSQPNLIFYGTSDGRLFKLANATALGSKPTEITGANFPKAFIACVAVDPHDANSLLVVFSNYGVQSLFASNDGGTTWRNASGTLEQNPDGSGDGPSCRWATIMHVGNDVVYLVGTSTGLYSTWAAPDSLTQWQKEGASTIGNITVEMMDSRETDHLVAVATQGRGIFSTTITSAVAPAVVIPTSDQLLPIYPSPASGDATIPLMLGQNEALSLTITDITGREVRNVFNGALSKGRHTLPFSTDGLASGTYFCRATSATGSLTRRFVVAH